ncbi:MAG: hypothetical protein HQM06_16695 [Magnetococcales bacterium]|nr:hypothetical protein [Magnetococcales bacterium]
MKQLGDLRLPDELLWIDRYTWSPVAQESARSINGRVIHFTASLSGGRPITLEAREGMTWFTSTQVQTLSILAAQAGAWFVLLWEDETFHVVFRHHDQPALDLHELIPGHPQGLHVGSIKLEVL